MADACNWRYEGVIVYCLWPNVFTACCEMGAEHLSHFSSQTVCIRLGDLEAIRPILIFFRAVWHFMDTLNTKWGLSHFITPTISMHTCEYCIILIVCMINMLSIFLKFLLVSWDDHIKYFSSFKMSQHCFANNYNDWENIGGPVVELLTSSHQHVVARFQGLGPRHLFQRFAATADCPCSF